MNVELAQQVLDQITRFPESHNQMLVHEGVNKSREDYVCGTAACVAGWAASFAGRTAFEEDDYGRPYIYIKDDGDWYDTGRDELGISEQMAAWLFLASSNAKAVDMLGYLIDADGDEEMAASFFARAYGYRPVH